MIWQERISEDVKQKIDIENAAKEFKRRINVNISRNYPSKRAVVEARIDMLNLLKEKGVKPFDAVQFLHFCEVEPYSGCGCCEYRK